MAKVYLDSGDTFTLSGAASVYGSSGTEKLIVNSGATGVVVDQTVERVDLAGASSAYTFQQSGNQLKVFSGTTVVATIPLQDDTDGTQVVFSNGSVSAKVGATGMTLGGAAVTSTAAAVTPTTIDATVTSGSGTSTGGTTAGQAFSLTTATTPDIITGTTGNDTVTGAAGTFATTDVITDATSTDNDTLNITLNAGVNALVMGVENINVAGQYTAAGWDATSTTGTKVMTLSTGISGGTATLANTKATATQKIVLGTNIQKLDLTTAAAGTGGTVTVDAGAATLLTVNGAAGTDAYTVLLDGDALTLNSGSGANIETLTLSSTKAANTVTLGNALNHTATTGKAVVTGDSALTIKADIASLTGKTIEKSSMTGTFTVEVTEASKGTSDLSKIAADVVQVNGTVGSNANAVTINEGSKLKLSVDSDDIYSVKNAAGTDKDTLSAIIDTATTTLLLTDNVETLALDFTKKAEITTLNTASDAGAETVVLSGSYDVKIGTLTATANSVLTATNLTGKLTLSAATNAVTVIGGQGNDEIATASTASIVQGGAGNDTITGGAGADTLQGDAGNDSITAAAGNDTITGGDGDDYVDAGADADSVDGGAGNDVLVGGAGADTIKGGDGADVITGGAGIDEVWGGAGVDTFILTTITVHTNASNIKDFEFGSGGDKIRFDATTFSNFTAATNVTLITKAEADALITADVANSAANKIVVATAAQIATLNFATAGSNAEAAGAMIAVASDTGKIIYDADGDFSASSVEIGSVQLTGISNLAGSNFEIV